MDAAGSEELRELLAIGEVAQFFRNYPPYVTVLGVVELACLRAIFAPDAEFSNYCESWAEQNNLIRTAFDAVLHGSISVTDNIWSARDAEFFPIRAELWGGNQHHCFESRFTQAARKVGFGRRAEGLAGAFREMADNVIQHSSTQTTAPALGLMGYFADDDAISFAVGDIGRGMLKSLRQNPQWLKLTTSEEAIAAVIYNQASRRVEMGPGTGFQQLFKSLVDLNGRFDLRSDDAQISITGSPNGREGLTSSIGQSNGVRIGVSAGIRRQVTEVRINS